MMKITNTQTARTQFERDGFYIAPPSIPQALLQGAITHMDAVIGGTYETGVSPYPYGTEGNDPTKLVKIDQAHIADRTLFELCAHPEIGRWAAAITGAKWIQLWCSQLLFKPPGGSAKGNVGWHQDYQYWSKMWTPDSEVFTCWVALVDVTPEMGPMLFARGSNRWGFLNEGDFFGVAIEQQREAILKKHNLQWDEMPAVMSAGAFTFHHKHTYHGSGPNVSDAPRRSFAFHLRTEKSAPMPGSNEYYVSHLNDPQLCPVIYQSA